MVYQYKDWIVAMLQGDFGHSFFKQQPVLDVIGDRMLNTVWLSLFSAVLIYLIGIPLGLVSGRWNDSPLDSLITGYTYLGFATPTFHFRSCCPAFIRLHTWLVPDRRFSGAE